MSEIYVGDGGERRTLRSLELRCPPLPQTLAEALELMERPEKMEVGLVTEMVQRDPIVVARLLHTANSAFYGMRKTIGSVDRAVVMLGPVAVAGIVLGMHMLKLRSILEGPTAVCFQRLIRHSTATAYLSRFLIDGTSAEAGAPADDESRPTYRLHETMGASFTCGLLHDFGKIILIYNFQAEAADLYTAANDEGPDAAEDLLHRERSEFGCDHTEAGEFAARKLNFPEQLIGVIRDHHQPETSSADPASARATRAIAGADLAARTLGYAFTGSVKRADAAEHPVWAQIVEADLPHFEMPIALYESVMRQRPLLDRYMDEAAGQT